MALNIPQRRIQVNPIQVPRRSIPLEQIVAVQGQNPVATGIDTAAQVIGSALTKRAALIQQGQQLAKLEQIAGSNPGSFTGLDISTATSLAQNSAKNQAENLTPEQIEAINRGDLLGLSKASPRGVPRDTASLAATVSSREDNKGLRQIQQNALAEEREKRRQEFRSKEKTDLVNKFNSDPGVRKINSSIDSASNVRELAMTNNPIAASAIPTYMARASGEVGALSEADKKPFGGSQAILSRLQSSLQQMATGRLTDENRKFLIELSDTMENSAINNLDRRAKDVSGQYGEASDFLEQDEIYKTLRPLPRPSAPKLPTNDPKKATYRWNPITKTLEPL